jgi:hypothetical protein
MGEILERLAGAAGAYPQIGCVQGKGLVAGVVMRGAGREASPMANWPLRWCGAPWKKAC